MPRIIKTPTVVQAAGNKPKQIEEFVGRVNTDDETISIARLVSLGWFLPVVGWNQGNRLNFERCRLF